MHSTLKLSISIFIDAVGLLSYAIPVWGEISDMVFAFIEGAWILYAYKSTKFAALGFVEELLPFTDVLPACTLAHMYAMKKEKKKNEEKNND